MKIAFALGDFFYSYFYRFKNPSLFQLLQLHEIVGVTKIHMIWDLNNNNSET